MLEMIWLNIYLNVYIVKNDFEFKRKSEDTTNVGGTLVCRKTEKLEMHMETMCVCMLKVSEKRIWLHVALHDFEMDEYQTV